MEQISMFEVLYEPIKINKPIYVIEMFGGIGSQLKALKRLGLNITGHTLIEVDINATISYAAIHCNLYEEILQNESDLPTRERMIQDLEPLGFWYNDKPKDIKKLSTEKLEWLYMAAILTNNLGDVFKIDVDHLNQIIKEQQEKGNCVLLTWSSPCQDFSTAGKLNGFDGFKGNLTGIALDIFEQLEKKPDVLLFENVPNIMNSKFINGFNDMRLRLENIGYTNTTMKLNAKNYGIPQNRNRVFILSIRNMHNKYYDIPKPVELNLKLKDMLEEEVGKKYYLSNKMIEYITNDNELWTGNNNKSLVNKEVASTINTGEGHRRCDASNYICDNFEKETDLKVIREFGLYGDSQAGSVFNTKGLSPTLTTKSSLNWNILIKDEPKILIKGNYMPSNHNASNIYDVNGISPTITTGNHGLGTAIEESLKIRKLTELECFRLMGFDDQDYYNVKEAGISSTQIYKQAGNSIVVNVLEQIFRNLFL